MTGMEDVLAAHHPSLGFLVCRCGWQRKGGIDPAIQHRAHVAEALAAAGFGNLHDAWAEGYGIGGVDTLLDLANGGAKDTPNPYPKVSET